MPPPAARFEAAPLEAAPAPTPERPVAAPEPPADEPPALFLRVPVADLPFSALGGGQFPSMQQSLWLTAATGQAARHGVYRGLSSLHPLWGRLGGVAAAVTLDFVAFNTVSIWLHEEWHRAVMTQRGIESFDDILTFTIREGSVAVSHVADADLVRLKRDHPAELVRLHAAGMEAELELARLYRRGAVFDGAEVVPDLFSAWYSILSVLGYRNLCARPSADAVTDAFNRDDGADVAIRDFTGLDCTAWAYDLHFPDEPYEARGVHPSGVGLDRYIRYSDLPDEGRSLLRVARNLGLLNFASPSLFGFGGFTSRSPFDGRPFRWNAGLLHHLTAYGHALSLEVLLHRAGWNVAAAYHHGMNARGVFPGLELSLERHPLTPQLLASVTAMAWLQPERLRYLEAKAEPGGLLRLTLDLPIRTGFGAYLEGELKSRGWVAGVLQLEPALNVRAGLTLRL